MAIRLGTRCFTLQATLINCIVFIYLLIPQISVCKSVCVILSVCVSHAIAFALDRYVARVPIMCRLFRCEQVKHFNGFLCCAFTFTFHRPPFARCVLVTIWAPGGQYIYITIKRQISVSVCMDGLDFAPKRVHALPPITPSTGSYTSSFNLRYIIIIQTE